MNFGTGADPLRGLERLEHSNAELVRACTALWSATLSLMVAFMHTRAPAHRCLMARRIARNFEMLGEEDCFTPECRAAFARLSQRWRDNADSLAHQEKLPNNRRWRWPGSFNR